MELLKKYSSELGIPISEDQLNTFQHYSEILLYWNSKFNITRITKPLEIQIKHFLDSITLLKLIPHHIPIPLKLIDIGSGGGFPGIPIKILLPNLKLTLVESTKKKCDFLSTVLKELNLEHSDVIYGRAEDLGHDDTFRNSFDIVTARALAQMSVLTELCLPFCKIDGNLVAWKTPDNSTSFNAAVRITKIISESKNNDTNNPVTEHITQINKIQFNQSLIQVNKKTAILNKYPRKNGLPKKRPL